jgi:hypothetical protein
MRVRLEPSAEVEGSWVVADVGLAYGGVAPKSIMAEKVRPSALQGEGTCTPHLPRKVRSGCTLERGQLSTGPVLCGQGSCRKLIRTVDAAQDTSSA